jgi:hypothetical protein
MRSSFSCRGSCSRMRPGRARQMRRSSTTSSRRFVLVGLYLMPFAGIAFVWFIVALRMWEEGSSHRRSVLQSNLQLISGIVYVALFFVAAAASSASC